MPCPALPVPTLPLFEPVSVLLEVSIGIFVSPFRSILDRSGPFRSMSVYRDRSLGSGPLLKMGEGGLSELANTRKTGFGAKNNKETYILLKRRTFSSCTGRKSRVFRSCQGTHLFRSFGCDLWCLRNKPYRLVVQYLN